MFTRLVQSVSNAPWQGGELFISKFINALEYINIIAGLTFAIYSHVVFQPLFSSVSCHVCSPCVPV
jgi:hypothetical protein